MKAKKHLGQHFLHEKGVLTKIRDAANPFMNEIVLEIGPGTGALTATLLPFVGKLIAIEKDSDLIPVLEERFEKEIAQGKLELLEEDVMNFNPELLSFYKEHDYKLVANIPYYITGAIIEKFLSTAFQPTQMVLLIQKEVAERIVARDGKESILSIAVKAYGTPKIIAKVPPGAFTPPPTVDSAILSIEGITRDFFKDADETLFFTILKGVFGQKRKQIGGTLGEVLGDKEKALAALEKSAISPKTRPEDMTLAQWKTLTQNI